MGSPKVVAFRAGDSYRPPYYSPTTLGHLLPDGWDIIDVLQCYELPFERASAIKYLVRAGRKTDSELQDLYKAMEFIQRRLDWLASQ